MLSTPRFNSAVMLLTHTLLDKPLRVLELPTQLTKLTTYG